MNPTGVVPSLQTRGPRHREAGSLSASLGWDLKFQWANPALTALCGRMVSWLFSVVISPRCLEMILRSRYTYGRSLKHYLRTSVDPVAEPTNS